MARVGRPASSTFVDTQAMILAAPPRSYLTVRSGRRSPGEAHLEDCTARQSRIEYLTRLELPARSPAKALHLGERIAH